MKTVDIARRAARSLRNAKARTILTSLAIAVGAFTIAISLAAGEGARQYADKLISSNVNPRTLFIVKDESLFDEGAMTGATGLREYDPNITRLSSGMTIKQMTQADVDGLIARGDLEYVTPTYQPQVQYMQFADSDDKFTSEVVTYDPTITSEVEIGSLPPKGEQLADDEAVIPQSYADTLVESGIVKSKEELIGAKLIMTAAQPTAAVSSDELMEAFMTGGEAAV